MAGAAAVGQNVIVTTNRPNGNGWLVAGANNGPEQQVTVFAVCGAVSGG